MGILTNKYVQYDKNLLLKPFFMLTLTPGWNCSSIISFSLLRHYYHVEHIWFERCECPSNLIYSSRTLSFDTQRLTL